MNVYRPRSMSYQTVWQVVGPDELTVLIHVSWKWISVCLTESHRRTVEPPRPRGFGSLVNRPLCPASVENAASIRRPSQSGPAPVRLADVSAWHAATTKDTDLAISLLSIALWQRGPSEPDEGRAGTCDHPAGCAWPLTFGLACGAVARASRRLA
jgi:hypothetical protein